MNRLHLFAVVVALCVWTGVAGADDKDNKPDKAKLIVGKWEVTKESRELPVGTVLEFRKDGKMTVTIEKVAKSASGTFKVDGDKLQITIGEDKRPPLTIKKLSEKELVLEAKKDVTLELKRLK